MSYPIHRAFRTLPGRSASLGFTLIELMITVLVSVVLVSLALPSFDAVFNTSRINSQANEFVATLQLARMEAIKHNTRVVVCPSTNGTTCQAPAGHTSTWTGWVAFVDDGGYSNNYAGGVASDAGDGKIDNSETLLRGGLIDTSLTVQTSADISNSAGGAITFRPDGLARDVAGSLLTGAFSVCIATRHVQQNISYVTINTGSRVTVVRHDGGGTCPTPPDAPTS